MLGCALTVCAALLAAAQDDALKALKGEPRACDNPAWKSVQTVPVKTIAAEIAASPQERRDAYRANLIHALGHIGSDEALAELRKLADAPDWPTRADAVMAMAHIDRPDVRKDLLARLDSEKDPTALGAVMEALVRLGEKGALKRMIEIVASEQPMPAPLAALDAIERLGDAETGRKLAELFKTAKDEWVRTGLAVAAARLGVKEMEPELAIMIEAGSCQAGAYFLSIGDLKGAGPFLDRIKGEDRADAYLCCESLRPFFPDLPAVKPRMEGLVDPLGRPVEGIEVPTLTPEDGDKIAKWFEENRAKLAFDAKTRTFAAK